MYSKKEFEKENKGIADNSKLKAEDCKLYFPKNVEEIGDDTTIGIHVTVDFTPYKKEKNIVQDFCIFMHNHTKGCKNYNSSVIKKIVKKKKCNLVPAVYNYIQNTLNIEDPYRQATLLTLLCSKVHSLYLEDVKFGKERFDILIKNDLAALDRFSVIEEKPELLSSPDETIKFIKKIIKNKGIKAKKRSMKDIRKALMDDYNFSKESCEKLKTIDGIMYNIENLIFLLREESNWKGGKLTNESREKNKITLDTTESEELQNAVLDLLGDLGVLHFNGITKKSQINEWERKDGWYRNYSIDIGSDPCGYVVGNPRFLMGKLVGDIEEDDELPIIAELRYFSLNKNIKNINKIEKLIKISKSTYINAKNNIPTNVSVTRNSTVYNSDNSDKTNLLGKKKKEK
jgi:hypothetical protein